MKFEVSKMEKSGSKLMQMQARFQQKQMQERELKIASLYEAQQARALDRVRHSPSNGLSSRKTTSPAEQPPVPVNPGKVRQMFEERRTKAGIDKSYPLQPIHNTGRPAPKKTANGFGTKISTSTSTTSRMTEKKTLRQTTVTRNAREVKNTHHKIESIVNGSGDLNHNHEPDMNSIKQPLPHSNGELISSFDDLDKADNNYLIENETFPDALAPIPTPRTPEPKEPKRPPRKSPASRNSPVAKSQPVVAPPRRVTSERTVTESSKARGAMHQRAGAATSKPSLVTVKTTQELRKSSSPRVNCEHPIKTAEVKTTEELRKSSSPRVNREQPIKTAEGRQSAKKTVASVDSNAPASAGKECSVCGRRFAEDRIAKHEEICRKASTKKRKPFDALKHRLQGTEAEQLIPKIKKQVATAKTSPKPLNSNWRSKHQDFINAIRAAKQVQLHLNAGGKLSDLPPPPPSENPDYVQCPHCQRRFNQGAAERHIPKCASYQFNKTKPPPKKR